MSERAQITTALAGALALAALVGGDTQASTLDLLFFGFWNVVFAPKGTTAVRIVSVGAVFAALMWRDTLFTPVALLAWLVWPPAYLVAWATARQPADGDEAGQQEIDGGRRARMAVAALIGAVAVASLTYRAVVQQGLEQTAALFVGVPAIIAIVIVLGVSTRSAVGVACKAVTIGLLVSLLFLWEGVVCVVMAAPLFYLVAVFVAYAFEYLRGDRKPQALVSCIAVLAVIPMSVEGVSDMTSWNRNEEVTATRIVHASAGDVGRALFATPRFDRVVPLYLRAGFPRPVSATIQSNDGRLRWIVRMRGGEMKINGMEPRAGDLVLDLVDAQPGWRRWRAVSDDSHMTHFLAWRETTIRWHAVGEQMTRVTVTLRYRRGLDPAWYFGPWERYAAGLAADYLIDAVATP